MSDLAEWDVRRNQLLLLLDSTAFGVGMAFLGTTTVLPNLIRLLGGGPVAVGVLGAIQSGGWMLPQLLAARYVANRPLVKPYNIIPLVASRSMLVLVVSGVWWLSARAPRLAPGAFILGFALFTFADALSGVPYFELLSKAVPLDRRARLMGAAMSLSSLLAIGVGVLVKAVLARPGPPVPNHLLLVSVAGAIFFLNPMFLSQLREPHGATQGSPQLPWRAYASRLAGILRADARLAWLVYVRWLSGLADMASTFWVLFAVDRLRIPEQMIGLFISASVTGGLLCGVILGPLGDRKGSAQVIRVVLALRCLCPVLALLSPFAAHLAPSLALGCFMVLFAAMGMANGSWFVGFTNYVLEIAPAGERSLYIGLCNTLCGLLLVAPPLAGWLVQTVSYELLFVVVLTVAVLGLGLALRGPRLARASQLQQA